MAKVLTPNSIADQIYNFIRSDILEGNIDPETRLTQEAMADFYQTSRTPVREAFRKLEKDGLVERLPQGGVKVVSISTETIRQVYGVRCVLEAYAIELALDLITDNDINQLIKIKHDAVAVIKAKELSREDKIKELFKLNSLFHSKINEVSGNNYLVKMIGEMKDSIMLGRSAGLRHNNNWLEIWKEHSQIINCLKRRNKSSCITLIKTHIEKAAKNAIESLEKRSQNIDDKKEELTV